ncbi:CBS domain-containing protein [Filimonas effusa]|uniref:CBS domain-containing protein n=1 Tax=Filimonas effusa TaxID=2508721 RepID=A0A4Q1CZQ0_9BACT|nr:CBS domain-containing protein [Filimonas effusa]RXK80873.1 CBS domain-containing protein [Filimonas effusa]
MLTSQLIVSNYPVIGPADKAGFALGLMEDYDVQHLPVVVEEKFKGLVSKDDLLDADEAAMVATLEGNWVKVAVQTHDHFLTALKQAATNDISLVAAINETGEYQGVITRIELLHAASRFTGAEDPGGIIVLEMDKRNFSFGEMSRLVETNDAYITQINTYIDSTTGLLQVTVKVNRAEISDIIATFQRYDYTIRYYFGEENFQNELRENYDLLMTYLKM